MRYLKVHFKCRDGSVPLSFLTGELGWWIREWVMGIPFPQRGGIAQQGANSLRNTHTPGNTNTGDIHSLLCAKEWGSCSRVDFWASQEFLLQAVPPGSTWRKENTNQAVCLRSCPWLMGLSRGVQVQGILKKSFFALLCFPLSHCKMLVWTLCSSLLYIFPKISSGRSWEPSPVENPVQCGCWGGFSLGSCPRKPLLLPVVQPHRSWRNWSFIHT